jgi:hypothetical protein
MPILLTLASAAMLAKFLEDEFLKRRGVDLYIDLTDWAKEIGISYTTLRGMMRNKSKDPKINRNNLSKLIKYFGPPVLDALGSPLPEKPSNPLYKISTNLAGAIAETHPDYQTKKEEK